MDRYQVAFTVTLSPNGRAERYPPQNLQEDLDGVYVYNASTTVDASVQFDVAADGVDDITVPAGEWRDLGFRIHKYVSVWASSTVNLNVVGYRRIKEPVAVVHGTVR